MAIMGKACRKHKNWARVHCQKPTNSVENLFQQTQSRTCFMWATSTTVPKEKNCCILLLESFVMVRSLALGLRHNVANCWCQLVNWHHLSQWVFFGWKSGAKQSLFFRVLEIELFEFGACLIYLKQSNCKLGSIWNRFLDLICLFEIDVHGFLCVLSWAPSLFLGLIWTPCVGLGSASSFWLN